MEEYFIALKNYNFGEVNVLELGHYRKDYIDNIFETTIP